MIVHLAVTVLIFVAKSSGLFQKPQWGYMKEHQWKKIWYDNAVNIKYKCIQRKETPVSDIGI